MRRAYRSFTKLIVKRIATHGVSNQQYKFLRSLWREDGMTQRELSELVGMQDSSTVAALNGLVQAGLVIRSKSTDDRRKIHIHLTEKARALEPTLLPLVAEVNGAALAGFSIDEIATLKDMLERVHVNLAGMLAGEYVDIGDD